MPTVTADVPGRLPPELPGFVGRGRELAELRYLLGQSRLVTLTGVGGVGKTRLALRAAGGVRRAFSAGVWLVDLTQLPERGLLAQELQCPDMLAYLVMASLGLQQGTGPTLRQLTGYLADRQTLLVLDNFEHLLPACAVLVDVLLRDCPRLTVLATSREPLAIRGEVLYPVAPLPVPEPGRVSVADLARCDSVALFLSRARATSPDFALTGANAAAVAELCRRLDGVPLAIELAAARVRILAPQQILDRLSDRFALLSRGSRDAPPRQRALRACVEWSFNLCSKPERLLWARASVFVGGFELDAIEGVCVDECLPADDLVDVLAGLTEKSIVERVPDGTGEQARYRMLETLRDFGQEQLRKAEEESLLRRRHCEWYLHLATRSAAERVHPRLTYWIARFTSEHSNIRAAVEFALSEPGQAEQVLRIVTGLPWLYWWSRGVCGEGLGWLDRAMAQTTAPTVLRVRALALAGFLAAWLGDAGLATSRLDDGEHLARRLRDGSGLVFTIFVRGVAAMLRGEVTRAIDHQEEGLALLSALPEHEQQEEVPLRVSLLIQLGTASALIDDHDRSRNCFREVLRIAEARHSSVQQIWARWGLGLVAWQQGDIPAADSELRACLQLAQQHDIPDPYVAVRCVEALAWIVARQGRHLRAAVLLGAADRAQTDLGKAVLVEPTLIAAHEACRRQVRADLGDAAFANAFDRGRALPLSDAVTYTLEQRETVAVAPKDGTTPLTRRERQVAELVAQGRTNKEIAARLVIARRTAEGHVERILAKLGLTNRTQLAIWLAEQPSPTTQE